MSFSVYNSDLSSRSSITNTEVKNFLIKENDIDQGRVFFGSTLDKYRITENNILLTGNIVLKRTAGVGTFNNERILRLPALEQFGEVVTLTGYVFSNFGNLFKYHVDQNGHVFLEGEIIGGGEEIYFHITPYIVEYPIKLVDF
ncbi:hypothetical protein [Aquimarina agarilytica]|uniref:hypothetical protein n=1 Tax=Aquimarina agarilytica TaxID=1087449 RepID=UPI000289BCA8|nr:hypothetical protein [Aquimarina agarilytica]